MLRRVPFRLVFGLLLAIGILGLLTACGAPADENPQTTFAPAGEAAEIIDDIYDLIWWMAIVVFVLVEGALVYIIFRYRSGARSGNGRPVPVHGNTRLEIIWTIVPAVILVIIAVPTLQGIADLADEPENALRVNVIGQQFVWQFEYPDIIGPDGEPLRTSTQLHIPVNTPIDITLMSRDVIHSFWVPRLAGKTDAIPGQNNTMWLEAAEPGEYLGQCAEFCGLSHALMRFSVIAESQEDFDAWVQSSGEVAADPVEAGLEVVESVCAACHTVAGTSAQGTVGPELTNFADDGTIAGVLEYNEENLRTWLADPPAVKPGTAMPNLGLSQQQIDVLVAYLGTLAGSGGQ